MKSPAPGRLLVWLRPRTRFTAVVVLFAFGGVLVTAGLVAVTGDERQVQAGSVVVDDSAPVADPQARNGEPVAALPRKLRPTRAEPVATLPRKLRPTRAEVARIRWARRRAAATPQATQLVVSPPAPALPVPSAAPVAPAPVRAPQAPTPVPPPAPQLRPPQPVGFDDSG